MALPTCKHLNICWFLIVNIFMKRLSSWSWSSWDLQRSECNLYALCSLQLLKYFFSPQFNAKLKKKGFIVDFSQSSRIFIFTSTKWIYECVDYDMYKYLNVKCICSMICVYIIYWYSRGIEKIEWIMSVLKNMKDLISQYIYNIKYKIIQLKYHYKPITKTISYT